MTVIPFDPTRSRPARTGGESSGLAGGPAGMTAPDSRAGERDPYRMLREANERIDILERALLSTLRENATNWARAEQAEKLLGDQAPPAEGTAPTA